jgi:threonine/homoserine/homoserine lactone efflux protein
MNAGFAVLSIAGTIAIGAISPGPSFVFVARTAIAQSRGDGLAAAIGMGIGGLTLCGLALLGLQAVLAQVGWLYLTFKILGAFYLLYLAVALWRGASSPIVVAEDARGEPVQPMRSFMLSVATQLSNPKAAVIYASIFAAFLPSDLPGWAFIVLPALIFAVEAGWYTIVAVVFSAPRPRAAYLQSKAWVDRAAGVVMGALGIKLIFDAARPA